MIDDGTELALINRSYYLCYDLARFESLLNSSCSALSYLTLSNAAPVALARQNVTRIRPLSILTEGYVLESGNPRHHPVPSQLGFRILGKSKTVLGEMRYRTINLETGEPALQKYSRAVLVSIVVPNQVYSAPTPMPKCTFFHT